MSSLSSFDLSQKLSKAAPSSHEASLSVNAYNAIEEESIDPEISSLSKIMAHAKSASGDEISSSNMAYAGMFMAASLSPAEREAMSSDVSARQLLALASIDENVPGADIKKAAREGGFPVGIQSDIASAIFNAQGVSDSAVEKLSGSVPVFSIPTQEDKDFAHQVLSSERSELGQDPLAFQTSVAVEALDIDSSGEDMFRLSSSLLRISSEFKGKEVPAPGDIALIIASDIATQARSSRFIDTASELVSEGDERIRKAMLLDEDFASEIRNESQGEFHKLSRGAAMDIKSDMKTAANLPDGMVMMISAEADRVSKRNPIVIERVEEKKVDLPVMPIGNQGVGM